MTDTIATTQHVVYVDEEGHLCKGSGWPGFDHLRCGVCGEPFNGILEMFGWVRNERAVWEMAHARCTWVPEAFDRRRHRGAKRPIRLLPRRRPELR